ncbi:unnamed protein product [Cuscuta epithymum]|uniref:non-specific serine/threonine protein kinase n=1 Tax=Cuscuta epithymum TaxID=186058 RepID=A0AAV0ED80_9ASTE|nr:unnamed protein product [Cuscuta epithymum]
MDANASPPSTLTETPPPPSETPPPKESPPPSPPQSSPPPPLSPPPSSPPPPTPHFSSPPPPSSPPPTPLAPPPQTPPSAQPPPSSPTITPPPPGDQSPPPNDTPSPPPPSTTPPPTPFVPAAPQIPNGTGNPPPSIIFSPPPPSLSPPSPSTRPPGGSRSSPPSNNSSSSSAAIIGGATVGAGIFIIALGIILFFCMRKRKKQQHYVDYMHPTRPYRGGEHVLRVPPPPGGMQGGGPGWGPMPMSSSSEFTSGFSGPHHNTPLPPHSPMGMGGYNQSQFTYEELAAATASFSQANLLGQGGFGYVHKGVLPNGREVAVKSLKSGSGQGEREFQAEVEIISRVHHRHLVSLVGYCIAEGQRMLVYEYVPNNTLEFHLHGKGQPVMDWPTRLKIAVGSAKGLSYLHEDCHPRIIHRDIKSANILLDNQFEAMVADFGLAKLSSDNNTHVSTRVMGTFGYLAPEYASSGKLTDKSDVFSFGVMLLELITGRRPLDLTNNVMEDSLVDWARPLIAKAIEDGNYDELVDPRLEGNYNSHEMGRMVACAGACIRHSAKRRPKMSQIVRAWEGDFSLDDLNDGGKGVTSGTTRSNETGLYDTRAYNADMLKFKEMVMSNQESSEFGGTTTSLDRPSNSTSSFDDSRENSGPR